MRIPLENRSVVITHGHPYKLIKERVRLDQRANYLFNRMAEAWNRLPAEVVMKKKKKNSQSPKAVCEELIPMAL